MVAPCSDLLKPRNGDDVHVGSGIQFLSSARCIHLFSAHDPCGTHSIWYCPFLLGLTSSEMTTLEIFHVALRVGPVTLRLSRGCIAEVNIVVAAWDEVVLDGLGHSLASLGIILVSLCLFVGICPCLLGLGSRFSRLCFLYFMQQSFLA